MDAWFWANILLDVYKYEINGKLAFSNGIRSTICDEYENLQKEYSAFSEQKRQENRDFCLQIVNNMKDALKLFLEICSLMQNDFKRPKALFTAFIFSYIYRNDQTLINNLTQRDNNFSRRIRYFSGEKIAKQGNEQIIEFIETILAEYKKYSQNSPNARAERHKCYEKMLIKD